MRDFRTYRDRALHVDHVAFLGENFFGSVAQRFDVGVFDLIALLQLFDPGIEIVGCAALSRRLGRH